MGRPVLFPRTLPLVLAALTVLAGCGRIETPEGEVVARVGDEPILAEDFARSFELGFPHLKQGDDPRQAYLEHMVAEKLLALEGYRLRLDTTEAVRAKLTDLREELLVEQVFEREVNAHVSVSDDEIGQALQQESVRFKLRYVPAATQAEAEQVRAQIAREGFDAALAQQLSRRPEVPFQPEDFVTPYLTAAEVPPSLFERLRELPIGEPSPPIAVAGQYVIAEVMDLRREPAASDAPARDRIRQALFQQKARRQARAFVTSRMEPFEVRVKAGVFRRLTRALWPWYRTVEMPPLRLMDALEGARGPEAEAVRAMLDEVLATTRDSTITVRALLRAFPAQRYGLSRKSEEAFQSDLYDAIGLTLRDASFQQQAEAQKLGASPAVEADLRRWRDKWIYQAMLHHMADTVQVSPADVADYRARHAAYYDALDLPAAEAEARLREDVQRARVRAALPAVVARLRARYPVTVNEAVLDAAVPADAATPGLPTMLFKAHTGRPLYPVVDPAW